jgi:superfamily II DNA or RNA helicase
MNPLEREITDAPEILLPHQAAFVDYVLGAGSKRTILLVGGVGLGKSTALVALASRLLLEQPATRSLFLVPAALRLQFVDRFRRAGTPALLVDRYRFREMTDSAGGGEFWPKGAVAVLSAEFARQADILESLASTQWDLLVADEGRSFGGARAELLRRVGSAAARVVLATAVPSLQMFDGLPIEFEAVVEWRRDELVDRDGRPLDSVPPPSLHEYHFDLSQAEQSLLAVVRELCEPLDVGGPQQRWLARALRQSLRSSSAPLEVLLQRLAAASEAGDDAGGAIDPADDDAYAIGGILWTVDRISAQKMSGVVAKALEQIERIQVDSKARAFGELLSGLNKTKKTSTRICVLTNFVATSYYLAAEIENHLASTPSNLRGTCQILNGSMSAEDRFRSLTAFSTTGPILVATRAVMVGGIDLSHVTDLVLYDIPSTFDAMQQVLGRFDRFGRQIQLNVHVLVPENGADDLGFDPVVLIREVIQGPR